MSSEERLTFDHLFDEGSGNNELAWLSPRLHYLLDEHDEPMPSRDLYAAERLLRDIKTRTVAKTHFVCRGVEVEISTVFLVLNHEYFGGPPVLWETMIFTKNCWLDGLQQRYTSRVKAELGHLRIAVYALSTLLRRHLPSHRRIKVALRRALKTQKEQGE